MLDRFIRIIADVLQVESADIEADRDLVAYGMDSARAMDLVVTIEDEFGVEISDEAMLYMRTANDIVRV